jgi:hypothetical protein
MKLLEREIASAHKSLIAKMHAKRFSSMIFLITCFSAALKVIELVPSDPFLDPTILGDNLQVGYTRVPWYSASCDSSIEYPEFVKDMHWGIFDYAQKFASFPKHMNGGVNLGLAVKTFAILPKYLVRIKEHMIFACRPDRRCYHA